MKIWLVVYHNRFDLFDEDEIKGFLSEDGANAEFDRRRLDDPDEENVWTEMKVPHFHRYAYVGDEGGTWMHIETIEVDP
jgi:hypothetical protein